MSEFRVTQNTLLAVINADTPEDGAIGVTDIIDISGHVDVQTPYGWENHIRKGHRIFIPDEVWELVKAAREEMLPSEIVKVVWNVQRKSVNRLRFTASRFEVEENDD